MSSRFIGNTYVRRSFSQIMADVLMSFAAYFLLWTACGIKRDLASRVKLFSKKWWLQAALLLVAAMLLREGYGLSH
jgi:hypothetical protein